MAEKEKKKSRERVAWWQGLVGSIILAVIVMFISRFGLFYEMELKTYDTRFMWRGPIEEPSDIVIVGIDDETFSSVPERYPFPRSYHARVVRNLLAAGARLIVFDIQFTEPSSEDQRDEDLALAEACALAPDRIIHAGKVVQQEFDYVEELITQTLMPIPELLAVDTVMGIVNEAKDLDGFSRQYQMFMVHNNVNYLALSMKALQIVEGFPDTTGLYRDEHSIHFGTYEIPTITPNTMLINFLGPAGHIPTYSFSSVLDDEEFTLREGDSNYMQWFIMPDEQFEMLGLFLPEESMEVFRDLRANNPFRDKIVFIGAAAVELQDTKKTPFYTFQHGRINRLETPGVEVHASALNTILTGDYIQNSGNFLDFLLVLILAVAVFFINNGRGLILGTAFTLLLALVVFVGIFALFIQFNLWVALIAPILSIALSYVGTTLYKVLREQKEKAMIRGMFSQYVPKKVVDALVQNPDMMALGGERRRMSALFTDVAGFTSVSERLTPEELVHLLNEYLSEMSRIILENEGIIDKYEGDLIMAEWGAPVYFEDHATWACRAALRMQNRLKELREVWKEVGKPELRSRVGINTGDMIVGNMGCLEVFDYTVMGDAVNLASRLEGANKSYNTTIMIGPETARDVKDSFVLRPLDNLRVKGKDEPVEVFELLAEDEKELPESKLEVLKLFTEGLQLFRDMEFQQALQKFEQALEIDPNDGPSLTYKGRCEHFIINPPPEDWDRVFVLTEK